MADDLLLNRSLYFIGLLMLVSLFLVTEVGYRIGRRHGKQTSIAERREKTVGTITGAMLALLGFMLAISLSMADQHFQDRRKLVLEEANALGTSYLRAQAVGGPHGAQIASLLKDYAQLRLDFFVAGEDRNRLKTVYEQTTVLQKRIWDQASAVSTGAPTPISALLLTSLNQVFDLSTSRRWALEVRVPPYVIKLLFGFSFLAMVMLGYYFGICGVRHPILSSFLLLAFTAAILLIMDLNRPRSGFIQPEQSPIVWVLEDMKHSSASAGVPIHQ